MVVSEAAKSREPQHIACPHCSGTGKVLEDYWAPRTDILGGEVVVAVCGRCQVAARREGDRWICDEVCDRIVTPGEEPADSASARARAARRVNESRRRERLTWLAEWVRLHGDASMRERLRTRFDGETDEDALRSEIIGIVPEGEIHEAIKAQVFARMADVKPYPRITREEAGCRCDRQTCLDSSSELETRVTAELWERIGFLKGLAPEGAVLTPRVHRCAATCRKVTPVVRHGVLVKVKVGFFDFHREFSA